MIKVMNKSQDMDMLNGGLLRKILIFALPLALSSMLQQLFNSADVAVVGRFAGNQALAAVGSNQVVINLLINLFVGLSVGANVTVAKYYGKGDKENISNAVHTSILVAVISGLFLIVFGFFMTKIMLEIMGTPEDVIDLAGLYLRIYFAGMPFIMVYNFGSAILRSVGDTKRPLMCLFTAGILNVILNLFFVIVCHLSVAGVAIATVISNMVSSGMILYMLIHEKRDIHLDLKKLNINKDILLEIIKIGLPAGVQGMVFSISNVCIQASVNSFGSIAIAGSAAALNFESFAFFLLNAFTQASVTFTSQNFGAKQYSRCIKIAKVCSLTAIVATTALCIIFLIFADPFISIYTTDSAVKQFGIMRMKFVLSLEFLNVLVDVVAGSIRGMGCSVIPAAVDIIGVCGFRLLWVATVFQKYHTFEMLMAVYPVSWLLTCTAMIAVFFMVSRKVISVESGKLKVES
ncbi:MAG: MATE family efflux transporter [Clostridium sp.]|nr:MATE family efflux transporter [Clostridium sp.]